MTDEIRTYNQDESIVVYQSEDNTLRLDVQFSNETVWLATNQMAMLFDKEESTIRRHIINIFDDGELIRENNVRFLHVNGVKKPVPFYNLDVIIFGWLSGEEQTRCAISSVGKSDFKGLFASWLCV